MVSNYYTHLRLDVLEHVPLDVCNVLSVGCGAGVSEARLVEKGIDVTGIELDHDASQLARSNGLTVIEADAENDQMNFGNKMFDCLIYADVLEHFVDPVRVLRSHVAHLRPGGTVIISVPNFRYYEVLWQLVIRGHVKYIDAGILDRTHLRITTRRMVVDWLSQVGLGSVSCTYNISRRRDKIFSAACMYLAKEFIAKQVIVVGSNQYGENSVTPRRQHATQEVRD